MPQDTKLILINQAHCGFLVRLLSHSLSYSKIPKIHYILSPRTIKGAVTIHISLITKQEKKNPKIEETKTETKNRYRKSNTLPKVTVFWNSEFELGKPDSKVCPCL